MKTLTILQVIEDPNPITNGKWIVIAKTESGRVVKGIGHTEEQAKQNAAKQGD